MTYLDALVEVLKIVGSIAWFVISLGGIIICLSDWMSENEFQYNIEVAILCFLSLIAFTAFILFKVG